MSNTQTLQSLQQGPTRQQMPVSMSFFNLEGFELMQRIAKAFVQSDLVPKQYQGNLPNCLIALDMAQRIGANPLMVMQNLYVVHGTPSWSSKFLIATVNTCGRFSALRYEWKGEAGKPDFGCRAWAIEKETGERLDGIWVTWQMVNAEGWASKSGSKWKTMPDQMFVYRAAAFWQRAYAPDLGMGLQTEEEVKDIFDAKPDAGGNYAVDIDALRQAEAAPRNVDTATGEILDAEPEKRDEKAESVNTEAEKRDKSAEKADTKPEKADTGAAQVDTDDFSME